jgi:hypothetical protein
MGAFTGCVHGLEQCPILIPLHAGEGFHIERRASRLPSLVNPGADQRFNSIISKRLGDSDDSESA